MTERKTIDLKSSCPACGTKSTVRYKGGVERHACKKCSCTWEKTPQSTQAALGWQNLGYQASGWRLVMGACIICRRDPARMNSEVAECSHVDCPHRRTAWSERPVPTFRGPWPKNVDADPRPLDAKEA